MPSRMEHSSKQLKTDIIKNPTDNIVECICKCNTRRFTTAQTLSEPQRRCGLQLL